MTNEILAIDKFICEALNFETVYRSFDLKGLHFNPETGESIDGCYCPRFLAEVKWTCGFDHMYGKWRAAVSGGNSFAFFIKFYVELDTANKEAMLQWILDNRERGFIHQ